MQFELFENNIDFLAAIADGQFIDLKVRPKSARKKFTKEQYTKECLERVAYHRKNRDDGLQPQWYTNHFLSFEEFTIEAMQHYFSRFRLLYTILIAEPPTETPDEREARTKRRQEIRAAQRDMDPTDRKLRCPMCALPVYVRDVNNNYIDLKKKHSREVCQCSASFKLRTRMKKLREEKRRGQEDKKKQRKKKDPKRYE